MDNEKRKIVVAKEAAVAAAVAAEQNAIAERVVAFTQLEKEKKDLDNLNNSIDEKRELVKKSYADLKEKSISVQVLEGRLSEAEAKKQQAKAENDKLIAHTNILKSEVNREKSIKESQEQQLKLINAKEQQLSAEKTLLIAEKDKVQAEFDAARDAHQAAVTIENEAKNKFEIASNNLDSLKNQKDENLKDSILDAVSAQRSAEEKAKELREIALKEHKEKLKVAIENEELAEKNRKEAEEALNKLNTKERFGNLYEYDKGEDCMTSIIIIMLIILFAGLYTGIIKMKK